MSKALGLPMPIPPWLPWVAGGLVIAVLLNRMTGGALAREAAAGVVETVGDAGAGVVLGVGDVLGVPRTDADRCRIAMETGNGFDASLYCPMPDYLAWEIKGRPRPSGRSGATGEW